MVTHLQNKVRDQESVLLCPTHDLASISWFKTAAAAPAISFAFVLIGKRKG